MVDRTDGECRRMLEVCGFTYDPPRDVYSNGLEGRVLSVDAILAHTQLWVAQWITQAPSAEPATPASAHRPTSPGARGSS